MRENGGAEGRVPGPQEEPRSVDTGLPTGSFSYVEFSSPLLRLSYTCWVLIG